MNERRILHVRVGSGDNSWEPTKDEIKEIRKQFAEAEADPTGAIVVTRTGVYADEVIRGATNNQKSFVKVSLSNEEHADTMIIALQNIVEQIQANREGISKGMIKIYIETYLG